MDISEHYSLMTKNNNIVADTIKKFLDPTEDFSITNFKETKDIYKDLITKVALDTDCSEPYGE